MKNAAEAATRISLLGFYRRRRGLYQAVRMGDWKGVRLNLDMPIELYNLEVDIGEIQDLATQYPGILSRIEEIFNEAHTDSDLFPVSTD